MQQSAAVREAMLRFYDRLSASDVGSFDQLVSRDPATLVIGTAPGEWVRYSTPGPEGAEYIAVCLPAFSMDTVHRDDQ